MNNLRPELLVWARERAGLDQFALSRKFPKLAEWEVGDSYPTLRQLENFARAVYVPIGYLFLAQPIQEVMPIPDFRTPNNERLTRPSPNLLDTIYICQQRQDWYRDHIRLTGLPTPDFIGSVTTNDDPITVAAAMREKLQLSLEARRQLSNWTEALRQLVVNTEEIGVMVMASSVVGSNSHRKLEVQEFRGFALADRLAPLIFINAQDSKSAQMFTLAHELAHLWLGQSGISNSQVADVVQQDTENWCNQVAAELLMPMQATRQNFAEDLPLAEEIQRLAKLFKVSTLVVLRRLFDAGFISRNELRQSYQTELERINKLESAGGGDFYRTLGARTGKRFAKAIITSTLEGQTLFRDAFRMLGMKKSSTFYTAAQEFGVMP